MASSELRIDKAMILAAGRGTRLRPLGLGLPKPMVLVGGKPLLEYTIDLLTQFGVREIVINLNYQQEMIRRHFGNGSRWGIHIHYSHEKRLLGTAGGVKAVEGFFDKTFLVWYGDNLCYFDLRELMIFHNSKGGIATLALHTRSDPCKSGIVSMGDGGRIERFLEKPRRSQLFSNLVNSGIYVLEPEVLNYIPKEQFFDFGKDLFPSLIKREEVFGFILREPLFWIDTPREYNLLTKAIESGEVRLR